MEQTPKPEKIIILSDQWQIALLTITWLVLLGLLIRAQWVIRKRSAQIDTLRAEVTRLEQQRSFTAPQFRLPSWRDLMGRWL
jgi:hypothetical protein